MAIIYDPKRDTPLTVDPTSKAMRGTLYDSSGNLISLPMGYPPDAQVYGYMAGVYAATGLSTSSIEFVMINRGATRKVLLRSIRVHQNMFNTPSNATASIRVDKVKVASPHITTGAGAVAVVGAYNVPMAKSSPAPPSMVDIIADATSATTFLLSGTTIATTIGTAAIPISTQQSAAEFQFLFPDDGPDSDFELMYCEALVFTTSASVVTNTATVNLEWEEVQIPSQRMLA